MEMDASVNAVGLCEWMAAEYPDLSPAASVSIRKWLYVPNVYDVDDDWLDGVISHYMAEAGYTDGPLSAWS